MVSDERFEVADGMLKLKDGMSLDHETADSVTVNVTVTDAGGLSANADVAVAVNNVNEGPSLEVADGAVDENAAGAMVGAVTVSDPDADDTHTYVVSDERFEVADGMLKLKDGMSLDHETEDSVAVKVTVTDAGGLSASADVAVSVTDVNEAPTVTITPGAVVPVKEVTSNSTVAENAMGSTVPPLALIEVTDPDDADSDMLNGALALGATTLSGDGADNFEVILDPLNGLWLALKAGASLDYESTGGSVTVTVTYTDSAGNAKSADATVTVTDANDAPVFAASEYAFDLNENADGSTTAVAVGMVSATDEDAGATQAYSITAGNDDGLFAIDEASGAVTYVGTGENYRSLATGAAHTLTVSVSDGTASAEATVAVTVLNVNEAPMFGESAYAFDLAENQDGSTDAVSIGKVSATDPDEGDPIAYSITSGNDAGLFAIDHYGNITYTGTGEDAESETTSYELMVNASDGGASSDSMVTVTVTDANDNAPAFVFDEGTTFYSFTLAENTDGSETAAAVGSVSATDADGDAVTYSIVDGNDDGLFAIDAETGAITYVGTGEDAESATTSHVLTVQASDATDGVRAQATVNVEDVNEAPEADAEMAIGTFAFVGGAEGRMEVDLKALFSDPDGDSLTYSLSSNAPDWLHFSTTLKGTGEDATVTGTLYGTPPAGSDMSATVAVVASDGNGAEGHAMFDVVVDAANAAPSAVELRITDADGLIVRTDTVTVDENDMGAVIGMVTVTDTDDARHPHGQHAFTFTVDGEADDRFEISEDGHVKLKDDASLNYEDGASITLTITATDMAVSEPAEGEDPTTGSASTDITIKVKDLDAGDGPVANEIGDWWVTVDEDLDDDDVRDGDWLSFRLRMDGLDDMPAFSDQDGDDLTFSVAVADSAGDSVDWLQIDDKGRLTNKAGMLPERGVYTVTVTATDEAENSAQSSFTLAVAISDDGDRDNDRPDIRDVIEYDYTEGDGARKVAEFTIRDDDLEIAPHPYGLHKVTLSGPNSDRFKLVPLGDEDNDPQTAQYAIWTKSAAELAVGADGKALKVPLTPLDYEKTEEVDITVTVTDGNGGTLLDEAETDSREITIDIDDAPDAPPAFSETSIDGAMRKVDAKTKAGTTTLKVDQQESGKIVVVVQLSEVWSDVDSDEDDLEFSADTSGLPDWVTVYGPDDWEDIYERRSDVAESDGPGVRDSDQVVVIVIDRTTDEDGDNVNSGTGLASFTLTAEDDDDNSTIETISIDVTDTNVGIMEDADDPVVSIEGDPNGTAPLMMNVNLGQDPDLDDADDADLVLYTWSHDNATADNADDDVTVMVSSTPQSLPIANRDGTAIYPVGTTFTATVQYYEVDPETGAVTESTPKAAMTEDPTEAQEPGAGPTSVSLDVTTDATGLAVTISATGEAAEAGGTARLEVSTDGESGWIVVDRAVANTADGSADVTLDVDANADRDTTPGDGGGLYYQVVYVYEDEDGDDVEETSEVVQLGTLSDPDGMTDIISADNPAVGETIRVNTNGADANVQWQVRDNDTMPWTDIDGADDFELEVTSARSAKMLRAKVTYTAEDNPATTDVDEGGWPIWVEYTEVVTVLGDTTNSAPVSTQTAYEIRVALPATKTIGTGMDMSVIQPVAVVNDSVADLFFDSDGDDLTYSIDGTVPQRDGTDLNHDEMDGENDAVVKAGGTVYTANHFNTDAEMVGQQLFAIDKDTGDITYVTDQQDDHDGNTDDGDGNAFTFSIVANDGMEDSDAVTVTVRVNVAPTAIELYDGTANAANLPVPPKPPAKAGTALTDGNGDVTYMDDVENAAVKVADLDIMDENDDEDMFGTHDVTLSGKGAKMFEIRETDTDNDPDDGDDDSDGSTWELWLKKDATFNFEALKGKTDTGSTTLYITVTAKDGGNLSTKGVFTVKVMDVANTEADQEAAEKAAAAKEAADEKKADADEEAEKIKDEGPDVPGLKDDSDDGDDDGAVPPPPEDEMMGFAPGDDLLDSFVLAIDDIDIA